MSHSSRFLRIGDENRAITITVPPVSEPVSLDIAKDHLRIANNDSDSIVAALVKRARKHVEDLMGRSIGLTTYQVRLDRFPRQTNEMSFRDPVRDSRRRDAIVLPFPPLLTASISYQDVDDVLTVLPSSEFTVDIFSEPGMAVPEFAENWPETRGHINDVTVTFTAGYDGVTHFLPESITHAILMLVSHWFEHREAAIEAPIPKPMAFAMDSLVSMNQVREFA